MILSDDSGDDDSAVSYEPTPLLWLIYGVCPTCGAEAKQPCVGQRFGPHEGRPARWE